MVARKISAALAIPFALLAGEITQEYYFTAPVITGTAVSLPGCHPFYAAYSPEVPVKPVRILVPDGQIPVSYTVTIHDSVVLGGRHFIRAHIPEVRLDRKPPANYRMRKSAAFSRNALFPAKAWSETFDIQFKNGHPVFMTQLYPVRYNPVTGTIRYYKKMSVTIETVEADSGLNPAMMKTTGQIQSELGRLVDNKLMVAKLALSAVTANDYEYLIITTDALKNGFGAFVEFNTRRGMRTKIATVESVKAAFTSGYIDDQERLRAYIKKEYRDCNIRYVLLAGDAEATSPNRIPDRKLYSENWDFNYTENPVDFSADSIPADMYYGCLDDAPHDWKPAPGKTRWGDTGTEDATFEVAVGRFPVDNMAELSTMIAKTIKYSEQPVESLCTRVLLAGEFLWGPPDHPVSCYGDDELEQLVGTSSANYGPLAGFPPGAWRITRLYARSKSWNFFDFTDSLLKAKSAIFNHEGHTNATQFINVPLSSMTASAFPQSCTPQTGNYFIALSGGCYPGAFDNVNISSVGEDCVAEHLTAGLATGAVAALFNSRYGFGSDGSNGVDPTDGSEQRLRRYFHHGLFGLGIHTLGKLDAFSKEANKSIWTTPGITGYDSYFGQMKWETYGKNIMGDPALSVWTRAPGTLTPNLPSPLTGTAFTMQVPPYSTIALADPVSGAIIVSATSGDGQSLTIENAVLTAWLMANPTGLLKVIVKAHNYYPWSGTVQVQNGVVGRSGRMASGLRVSVNARGVRYRLGSAGEVSIDLYNAKGVCVSRTRQYHQAGEQRVGFDKFDLAKGMYYCRLVAVGETWTGRIFLPR